MRSTGEGVDIHSPQQDVAPGLQQRRVRDAELGRDGLQCFRSLNRHRRRPVGALVEVPVADDPEPGAEFEVVAQFALGCGSWPIGWSTLKAVDGRSE
jgi:hypothetical protein